MTTKKKKPLAKHKAKSQALHLLEQAAGEPLRFSNMLLAIRECDEISQAEFSETLGISRQNLCDIEKGRKGVSPARAARFAKLLGYPAEVFVMLAINEELEREGLSMHVSIAAA